MFLARRILILVGMLLIVSISATFAQTTYTIEGRVVDSTGIGVAGVEVFLGLLDTSFEARYTCTDAEGYYSFTEVPDVQLISAVGPDVDATDVCAYPNFTNATGDPFVIQFYNGQGRSLDRDMFSVSDSPINYTLSIWDTGGTAVLRNLVVQAHRTLARDLSSGNLTQFYNRMTRIIDLAERFEDRGLISTTSETSIINNANNYLTVGG